MIIDANIQTSKGGISDSEIALLTEQIDKLEAPYVFVQEFLVLTLSEDGTYYIVGDDSENYGNALASTFQGGEVVIPTKYKGLPVKKIGKMAFHSTSITNVVIPEGVTEIGDYSFNSCTNIKDIILPDSIISIGINAFTFSSLNSIKLPNSELVLREKCFNTCTHLTSINIPSRVQSIGNNAFDGCSNLSTVTLEEGLKTIGNNMFINCTRLTNIIIPASVQSIGSSAFSKTGLTSIQFNHTDSDILSLPTAGSSTGMLYNKTAKNMTIYHNNNSTILNYAYSTDNITPTFVQL